MNVRTTVRPSPPNVLPLDYRPFLRQRNCKLLRPPPMSKKTKKTPKDQSYCPNCGEKSESGDRFCRKCGAALSPDAKVNGGMRGLTGLRAFGIAVIALAIFYAILNYGGGGSSGTDAVPSERINITDVGAPSGGISRAVTPRDNADALFDQAMFAYETGDSAAAQQFIPMAIAAYQGLAGLDPDAHYHLALMYLASNRPEDALAETEIILTAVPDHLLGLSATARAYDLMGRADLASEYYQRFLDTHTPDVATSRPEYISHANALAARLGMARTYVAEH